MGAVHVTPTKYKWRAGYRVTMYIVLAALAVGDALALARYRQAVERPSARRAVCIKLDLLALKTEVNC